METPTVPTKARELRTKIPKSIMAMFDNDPEFIHIIDGISPIGTMIFPVEMLQKLAKNPDALKQVTKGYDIVLMPTTMR
jgi:hypothetical protein